MTSSFTPAPSSSDLRARSRRQFESWSRGHHGSLLESLFCRPTNRLLLEVLPHRVGGRLLDIGCGKCFLLEDLLERSPELQPLGLDFAEGMLRVARRRTLGSIPVLMGDSGSLPFASGTFDLVICTHCFHHFPNQRRVVREMSRILRPGGLAFVLDGDRDQLWGRILYDVIVTWAEGPVRHCSRSEMVELFEQGGFEEVHQRRRGVFRPVFLTAGRAAGSGRADLAP